MATLSELVIKLSADTAALRTDFAKAQGMAEKLGKAVKFAFSTLAGGITIAGLTAAIKSAANFGDQMEKASIKTGLTVKQISGLAFAARQSGVEFEEIEKALTKFSKGVSGLESSGGTAEKALRAIGLTARDSEGHMLPLHDLLLKVAEKFQQSKDGGEKAAIAMALFGRAGAQLIPLLNEGAAGIEKLEARAKSLGIVLDAETAAKARLFNDELDALTASLNGLKISLASKTFEPLTLLIELFLRNKNATAEFRAELELLGVGLQAQFYGLTNFFGVNNKTLDELAAKAQEIEDRRVRAGLALKRELGELGKLGAAGATDTISIPTITTGSKGKDKEAKSSFAWQKQALTEYGQLCDELRPKLSDTEAALQQYFDTLRAIWAAEAAGFNVEGLALQNEIRFNQEYTAALEAETAALNETIGKLAQAQEVPFTFGDARLGLDFSSVMDKNKVEMDLLREGAKNFGQEMSNAFAQMIVYGRGFTGMLQSILAMLVQNILQATIFKSLAESFSYSGNNSKSGGFFSNLLGGLFSGMSGHALGGGVRGGEPILVGERGPEVWVPPASGRIIPNHELRAANRSITYSPTYNINTPNADSFRKSQGQIMSEGFLALRLAAARNG